MAKKIPDNCPSPELFRKLFVHRDDAFAYQKPDGSYGQHLRRLADQDIKDHYLGKHTIGLYQLKNVNEVSTVKWACLDIDLAKPVYTQDNFKIEDWDDRLDAQADIAANEFKNYGMPYYLEDSGGKGRHLWIFFNEPIDAGLVQRAMRTMFKNMVSVSPGEILWEIFPKQTKIGNDFGNLVKMPFSRHQKTGRWSKFFDIDNLISNPQAVNKDSLEKTQDAIEAVFSNCIALRNLRDKGIATSHLNHQERLNLAYIYWNIPGDVYEYDEHEGANYLEDKVFSKMSLICIIRFI